jgi:predicted AlkP superfamily phosphohydrolase/phosphomutase
VVSLFVPMTGRDVRRADLYVAGGLECATVDDVYRGWPELREALERRGPLPPVAAPLRRVPREFAELDQAVTRTVADFESRVRAADTADALVDWGVLCVQFQALDAFQHRCWDWLVGESPGEAGTLDAVSVRTARRAMTALDRCVGRLADLAERRGARLVLVSDHGFGAYRGRIDVAAVLGRAGLLGPRSWSGYGSGWAARAGVRLERWFTRRVRGRSAAAMPRDAAGGGAYDLDRSRVLPVHGDLGACLYVNRPGRFAEGRGPRLSESEARQAVDEAEGALRSARHPESGTPLFEEVLRPAERAEAAGCDVAAEELPDLVAVPAEGWHTAPRNARGPVVTADRSLQGTHRADGLFALAGLNRSGPWRTTLSQVPSILLAELGIDGGAARRSEPAAACAPLPATAESDEAAVLERLRDLGYLA